MDLEVCEPVLVRFVCCGGVVDDDAAASALVLVAERGRVRQFRKHRGLGDAGGSLEQPPSPDALSGRLENAFEEGVATRLGVGEVWVERGCASFSATETSMAASRLVGAYVAGPSWLCVQMSIRVELVGVSASWHMVVCWWISCSCETPLGLVVTCKVVRPFLTPCGRNT